MSPFLSPYSLIFLPFLLFLDNQPGEIEALLFYESYYSYIIPEFEGKLNNTLITKIPTSTIGKSKDNNEGMW